MYVVTGATGFIGSNLLAEMERRGYRDIVAVDTFGVGDKWKNVAKRGAMRYVFPCQLASFMEQYKERIEAVFHLGAISSTTETDVDKIVENNFQLTRWLYEFCSCHGIQFIYASSAATYGSGEEGYVDCDDIDFISKLRPLNPYGWSKNAIDKFIAGDKAFADQPSQVVGLKFFNVYGPNEYHKGQQMSVMRHFYEQYRQRGRVCLFKSYREGCADGEQRRDFVWVGDCVNVMLWMREHREVRGLFNVGTGSATTYNTVARSVASSMCKEPVIEYIDMPDNVRGQYQYFTEADLSKLRSVGYGSSFLTVEEGVERYIKGYLSKGDCYL